MKITVIMPVYMLHNSFTPARIRALSAEAFVKTDTWLATLLKRLLKK